MGMLKGRRYGFKGSVFLERSHMRTALPKGRSAAPHPHPSTTSTRRLCERPVVVWPTPFCHLSHAEAEILEDPSPEPMSSTSKACRDQINVTTRRVGRVCSRCE